MLADRGEPLFYAAWEHAVFIHYETEPAALQSCVPFALDLYQGRAFVSIVAFTLRGMRPRIGGKLSEWLLKPIATHHFFNVRTYVCDKNDFGIFFMAEWLSNRLSVALGPSTFGLPYRYGRIDYRNAAENGQVGGRVAGRAGVFQYHASVPETRESCRADSLDEFLLERYTAFTAAGRRKQFFRVGHEPWQQTRIEPEIAVNDLMSATGSWWTEAKFFSANYSPGVNVWMGWPHRINT